MSRQYFLGEDGEAAYKRLESSLRLGPESGRALVASDSVDVRYEVRRRVGEILPVKVVRPGDDVVKRVHEAVAEVGSPVLVWIEAEAGVGVESEAWRQAYAALNMGRDVLAEQGGVSLVLAGPRGIKEQVAARAPDLASVIRPMLELGTRLDRVADARDVGEDRQQAHAMADVLAKVVPDLEEARMIAERAGFPREHLPESKTPAGFWSDVVGQAVRGRSRPQALIEEAGRQFPYNAELLAYKEKIGRATHVHLDDVRVRLRRLAATKHRNHVFAQLPAAAPKPLGMVWDAFVPLDFAAHEVFVGRGEDVRRPGLRSLGVTIDLETLVERIDPVGNVEPATHGLVVSPRRAFAVLGDPGSGKTTLCRWLAATIAEREAGRAPILVEAGEWMRREGSLSLMDAMVTAADLGVADTVSVEDLKGLCDEGKIVLLVDGYDEPVRANARSRMRDMLEVFSAEHPKVAIVATSRVEGYLEAALPVPWQAFVIAPFDEGKVEDFVRRWYAMVESDPEARARGRAELMAALAAEPRAREMARNPLLATLIAELHYHRRAPLPGRRSELYDLVVELLLVTRPAGRERSFTEIEQDEQRVLLERFALWLQEQRSAKDGADIEFGRDDFVREVTTAGAGCEAVSRRRAQRWLDWLVQEAGLLRETGNGRYSFLHLSIMEYLAGRGLLARYTGSIEALGSFIAKVSFVDHWRETILLSLGSEAGNPAIASSGARAVIGGVRGRFISLQESTQWCLGLLLEDLELSAKDRESLLFKAMKALYAGMLEQVTQLLEQVITHSRRHGTETERWILARIAEDKPRQAAQMAAACPPYLHPELVLARRVDRDEVVPFFLDLSTEDRGRWAEEVLSRAALLKWAAETHPEVASSMAWSRLATPDLLTRVWTIAILSRSDLSMLIEAGAQFGKYVGIRWWCGKESYVKGVMPTYCGMRVPSVARRPLAPREDLRTSDGAALWRSAIARRLGAADASALVEFLSRLYYSYLPWCDDVSEDALLAKDYPRQMLEAVGIYRKQPEFWQAEDELVLARPSVEKLESIQIETLLSETHAARLMTPGDSIPYRLIALRLDNLFIHDFFDGLVDLALERGTEHDCLPLLLALGFSQYQTTWSWPSSRHWQQWFSSPPPADWLAAFFWHLCWAVGDVERYTEHYAAAQACLDRADWPELAAELRAYTIRPMTVEEWQRGGDPSSLAPTAQ